MAIIKLLALFSLITPNAINIHKSITELPNANQEPRMVTMSFHKDTTTQMAFNWNTTWKTDTDLQVVEKSISDFDSTSVKEYKGTSSKGLVTNDGFIHQAVATNLTPNTSYVYRVGDKETNIWSQVGEFKTAGNGDEMTFVHISDPQGYEEIHYDNYNELLKAAVQESNPDFFMLSGDIVNDSYIDSTPKLQQWEWALTKQKEIMQNYPFMTTPGNHEEAANDYNSRFNLPVAENGLSESGSYYSFDYQGSHFISLNTNDTIRDEANARGLSDNQMTWLENDLKAAKDSNFIVVMMHKGIYDAGGHCSNLDGADYDIEKIREQLSPLFTTYNVDLVLQGHDHLYSRSYPLQGSMNGELVTVKDPNASKKEVVHQGVTTKVYENPNGTIYLNSGTASGSKYYAVVDYDKEAIPLEVTDSPSHRMFTEITIEGKSLYGKVYKLIEGENILFDSFGIEKNDNKQDNDTPTLEPDKTPDNNEKDNDSNLVPIICIVCGVIAISGGVTFILKKKSKNKEDNE